MEGLRVLWPPAALSLLLGCLVSPAGSLDLAIFESLLEASANEDVLLTCLVSGCDAGVNVTWSFRNGTDMRLVCSSDGRTNHSCRPGARPWVHELRTGNAALFLSNVQFDEEGEYTCTVFCTSKRTEKTSLLQVSAQPKVSLSPQKILITNGSVGFLRCEATGFYPHDHQISWVKVSRGSENDIISSDFSTEYTVANRDGTFRVSSQLRIKPNLDDDGNKYSCVVTHRTLNDNIALEAKLTVEEPTVLPQIVGGISVISLIVLLNLALFCCCRKQTEGTEKEGVPPRISELSKPDHFAHGVASHMNWEVSGFTPRMITIALFVRRKGKEPQKLFEWNLKNDEDPLENDEEALLSNSSCVLDGNKKEDSITAAISMCVQLDDGSFSVKCMITVCPDASEDDGAEVTLEVNHKTHRKPFTSSVTLVVDGVAPTVTEIDLRPEIKHSEVASLSWSVTGFTPKPISIVFLLKRKGELKEKRLFHWRIPEKGGIDDEAKMGSTALTDVRDRCEEDDAITSVTPHCVRKNNGTFSVNCSIWMTADMCRDDGAELIVEVNHKALKIPLTTTMTLHVTGVPPTITEIKKPSEITPGELASLSWAVVGFSPRAISIVTYVKRKGEQEKKKVFHWRIPKKDEEPQEAKTASVPLENVTEGCEEDGSFTAVMPHYVRKNNGMFSVNCSVWMCADLSKDDGAELMVQVVHEALKEPLIESVTLQVTDGGN
ncbi:uncharacterized protein LOC121850342 [Callorhinchus milii]|uniref:uncharacterized protein LOC121850342 n=1 Tax=Callorhinchus milii TaxID=7868 RepID=UPI001C3F788D|nr:uncharacterized protein LOC121850342 [Callorhinchus milii]